MRARGILKHRIGPHRPSDVFEALLAQIGELNPELAPDLVVDGRRDADAVGFCYALKPRRDAHAIPEDAMNIAARLESIADPDSICITSSVYDQVRGKLGV